MSEAKEVTSVEFHDGTIESVTSESNGDVTIAFSHLSAYVDTAIGKTEVWSYSASLKLSGVTEFTTLGERRADDYVADGGLFDPLGKEVDLADLIARSGTPGRLDIVLAGSGAKVKASFSACALTDLRPIKYLEDWEED